MAGTNARVGGERPVDRSPQGWRYWALFNVREKGGPINVEIVDYH